MVVKIRLSRWGARHNPFYGIVVSNARTGRDTKPLERVGTYNPIPNNGIKHVELDIPRIKYWLSVGAQPTERVHWLLSKMDLIPPSPKQLQALGQVSLTDIDTWDVQVQDTNGNIINRISALEAKEKGIEITGSDQLYPNSKQKKFTGLKKQMDSIDDSSNDLILDGTPPKVQLTQEARLSILKKFTGI